MTNEVPKTDKEIEEIWDKLQYHDGWLDGVNHAIDLIKEHLQLTEKDNN